MTTSRASRWNRPEPKPDADPCTRRRMRKGGAIVSGAFCVAGVFTTVFLTWMQHDLLAHGKVADATVSSIRPEGVTSRRKATIPRRAPSDGSRRRGRAPAAAPLTPSSTRAPPASPDR